MTEKNPQEFPVIIRFKEKQNPGNQLHLTQAIRNFFRPKGVEVLEEGTNVVIEI